MIFLTVGTHHFDALVEAVDRGVAAGRIPGPVVAQIGMGAYEPVHCEFFRSASSIAEYLSSATIVIGHGGTGTTIEALAAGKQLVSVANPMMKDQHQHQFLERLEELGYLVYCRDLALLPDAVTAACAGRVPADAGVGRLFERLARDIDDWGG